MEPSCSHTNAGDGGECLSVKDDTLHSSTPSTSNRNETGGSSWNTLFQAVRTRCVVDHDNDTVFKLAVSFLSDTDEECHDQMSDDISVKLSEVMKDIGVTEKMVKKRRRSLMIMEVIDTCTARLVGRKVTAYNLGSQSEGTTTIHLNSDIDTLYDYHNLNLIHDWENAELGAQNVLIVQNEKTAPGHCFLQVQSKNISFPSPLDYIHENNFFADSKGRLFLKNTCFDNLFSDYDERNGPAYSFEGQNDEDNVIAWHCKYWPTEAQQWLENDGKGIWPSEGLKRKCKETGCTIVPISSKGSQFEELEWRISTCLAERCLMFSLNMTQIRCYVLMKLIRKTFIEPKYPDTISSYICKSVLFHCLQDESSLTWQENQLIRCLMSCLNLLVNFVRTGNCPHFFIPMNNLLKGKISEDIKYNLLNTLIFLKKYLVSSLCKISLDDFRSRFLGKPLSNRFETPKFIQTFISARHLLQIASFLSKCRSGYSWDINFGYIASINQTCYTERLATLLRLYGRKNIETEKSGYKYINLVLHDLFDKTENELEKSAYKLLIPFFRSSLASTLASQYIDNKKNILAFPDVITSFLDGINSDMSSGKLKFASALYCSAEINKTKHILEALQQTYNTNVVEPVCACNDNVQIKNIRPGVLDRASTGCEELIREIASFCVQFLPCEVKCVPHELKYEMFRSTAEEKEHQRHFNDDWMGWAVVDSLPFLYFLQYKVYGHLQETGIQRKALLDLAEAIKTERNLGHRETALNLLGQCMEQENRYNEALDFYIQSLNLLPNNNAAKIHICLMISTLINRNYCTGTKKKSKKNKKKNQKYKLNRKK